MLRWKRRAQSTRDGTTSSHACTTTTLCCLEEEEFLQHGKTPREKKTANFQCGSYSYLLLPPSFFGSLYSLQQFDDTGISFHINATLSRSIKSAFLFISMLLSLKFCHCPSGPSIYHISPVHLYIIAFLPFMRTRLDKYALRLLLVLQAT